MADRPHFHLGDIGVRIDLSFFVVIGVIGMFAPGLAELALWVAVATVSVLVHELGHAVAFRRFGSPASIQLHGLGGLTTGRRLPPARNLVVSLAGPLAGILVLGVPAVLLAHGVAPEAGSLWSAVLLYAIYINVFWSLVNLLPVLPLDGGNVVHSLLSLATGRDAERVTQVISVVFSAAAGGVALWFGLTIVALLAGVAAAVNLVALGRRPSQVRAAALAGAQRSLALGDALGAVRAAEPVVSSSGPAPERGAAVDVQVWAWLLAGEPDRARLALQRRPTEMAVPATLQGGVALLDGELSRAVTLLAFGLVHDPAGPDHLYAVHLAVLRGALEDLVDEVARLDDDAGLGALEAVATICHHGGWYTQAASVAALRFSRGEPDREVWAYNTACSLSRARRHDEALSWLRTAVEAGWHDTERLAGDRDLDELRSHPGFAVLVAEVGEIRR
jgi:stage IV sporulation protein FB